jgi:hypothetical protein
MDLDGTKKVDVFDLKIEKEKKEYENLMNDPRVSITKEEFAYVKTGNPAITVWYLLEET